MQHPRCLRHPLLHCQKCMQSVCPPTAPAPRTCVASLSRLRRLSTTVCEWSADCLLGPPPENVCRSEIAWLSACGGGSTKGCGRVRARHAQRPRQYWCVKQGRQHIMAGSIQQQPAYAAANHRHPPPPICPTHLDVLLDHRGQLVDLLCWVVKHRGAPRQLRQLLQLLAGAVDAHANLGGAPRKLALRRARRACCCGGGGRDQWGGSK